MCNRWRLSLLPPPLLADVFPVTWPGTLLVTWHAIRHHYPSGLYCRAGLSGGPHCLHYLSAGLNAARATMNLLLCCLVRPHCPEGTLKVIGIFGVYCTGNSCLIRWVVSLVNFRHSVNEYAFLYFTLPMRQTTVQRILLYFRAGSVEC